MIKIGGEILEEKHLIKIENFEGPLDLLCYLIDKNKMNIFDIKLDEVTAQYIEYLEQMEEYNIEIASEFVVMASTLIYLKSKRLLPMLEPQQEEEISEEELARRIVIYKLYKDYSNVLKERYEEYGNRVSKFPDNVKLPKPKIDKVYDKQILVEMYFSLLKRKYNLENINYENINKLAEYEKVTVRSKARDIIKHLMKQPKFIFNKLFLNNNATKLETVTSFLSLLELAKLKRISVEQEQLFGDIIVQKIRK